MAEKQKSPPKISMIHCEICGEDYATTYKRCPFCDEKPGKGGGKRNTRGGGYGRRNPLQIVVVVLSLVLILTALYIAIHAVAPLLGLGDQNPGGTQTHSTGSGEQTSGQTSEEETPSGESGEEEQPPEDTTPAVRTGKVNSSSGLRVRSGPGTDYSVLASLANNTQVTILSEVEGGWYQISFIGSGGRTTEGYVSKDYIAVDDAVPAAPETPAVTEPTPEPDPAPETPPAPDSGVSGRSGTVTGAGSGLRVRSGPGSSHSTIASLSNGSSVKILDDAGDGWYHISFRASGGKTVEGYVSKDYITLN